MEFPLSEVARPEFVECFSGNELLPGSETASHCYCGHQFGNFAGQLGDGCAQWDTHTHTMHTRAQHTHKKHTDTHTIHTQNTQTHTTHTHSKHTQHTHTVSLERLGTVKENGGSCNWKVQAKLLTPVVLMEGKCSVLVFESFSAQRYWQVPIYKIHLYAYKQIHCIVYFI